MTSRPACVFAVKIAAQARGAALRSGISSRDLEGIRGCAVAKAATVACASRDLAAAANRFRTGFAGYAKLQKMKYPGDTAGWLADRATSIRLNTRGLVQDTIFGHDTLSFGISLGPAQVPTLIALVSFADDGPRRRTAGPARSNPGAGGLSRPA